MLPQGLVEHVPRVQEQTGKEASFIAAAEHNPSSPESSFSAMDDTRRASQPLPYPHPMALASQPLHSIRTIVFFPSLQEKAADLMLPLTFCFSQEDFPDYAGIKISNVLRMIRELLLTKLNLSLGVTLQKKTSLVSIDSCNFNCNCKITATYYQDY